MSVPTQVDIGFHYTNRNRISQISLSNDQSGLLATPIAGASLGDGIYTSNNMFAFRLHPKDDLGVLVARLVGKLGRN
jgi:hypothetical protein